MTVLDTNVVSELLKVSPHPAVLAWFSPHRVDDLAITVTTVMEMRYGIERLPTGRRRRGLTALFDDFLGNAVAEVVPFDLPSTEAAAAYLAERERSGRPLADVRDAQIAGIVRRLASRDGKPALLATHNTGDFIGIPVVDPWIATP